MFLLFTVVVLSIAVSAFCSLVEGALYSVPLAHVKHLAEDKHSAAAKTLLGLKEDISTPIAAILILNTIAMTSGSAIAGAMVTERYGDHALVFFAAAMTVSVLLFGEMIPKIIGVSLCRPISLAVAIPLQAIIRILKPLVLFFNWIASHFRPQENHSEPSVSQEEVLSMAALGTEEGALDRFEGQVIENVIGLDQVLVREVLTPRVKVFRVDENLTIQEIERDMLDWYFTRVPLYTQGNPDQLNGYVRQRDIFRELIRGNRSLPLREIARPIETVPELLHVDQLLFKMFEDEEHICAVVDEHGALAGIITLEDIIEEVVGREIIDEYDVMRKKGARLSDLIRAKKGTPVTNTK